MVNKKGEYLIRHRSEKGLLHGLWEFPWQLVKAKSPHAKTITHIFTYIKLTLEIVKNKSIQVPDGIWVAPDKFKDYPFSKLMLKVMKKI